MYFYLFAAVAVISVITLALAVRTARKANKRLGRLEKLIRVVVLLVAVAGAWHFRPVNADNASTKTPGDLSHFALDCPTDVSDDAYKVVDPNWPQSPPALKMNSSNGELIGNGSPVNGASLQDAVNDVFGRTYDQPMLTATLAYGFHLKGFVPDGEADDQRAEKPLYSPKVTAAFLNERTAALVGDRALWSQTRREICVNMSRSALRIDPTYKATELLQLATRQATTEVDGATLPNTAVLARRTIHPDGLPLMWINPPVQASSDGSLNKLPFGVDLTYAWVSMVGEIPTDVEICTPTPDQQDESQKVQSETGKTNTQEGSGQSSNSSGGGGNGGGSGGNCGGNCNGGNATTTGGNGGNCGGGCGGNTPSTPAPTSPPNTVPPTVPPTTPPPTAPPTTRPPVTTTQPPPTVPPTTTPTTRPPSTTTPPTTKSPDPGCDRC